MNGPSPSDMREAFVEAYCEAARNGAEMRSVANALEAIKEMMAMGTCPYLIWAKLDESIGMADPDRLMPVMTKLCRQWEHQFTELEIARVKQAFSVSPEHGWRTWLNAYAASFDEQGWRFELAMALARDALEWSPESEWPLQRIRHCVEMVMRLRWAETYDWFLFLSRQELPPKQRVNLLISAAEIQLWYFQQPTKTLFLIREAEKIARDDPLLLRVWGEYWLQQDDLNKAKEYLQKLIQQKPNYAEGFCRLGDVYDKDGDLSRAESQFQQAIANAPGMTEGYRCLLNFHGKPAWFAKRKSLFPPLVERMKALTTRAESVWVELGVIYNTNRLFQEARDCYQKAIDIDEQYLQAITGLAYSYMDEGAMTDDGVPDLWAKAKTAFTRAIEIAPHSLDGYWGMAGVTFEEKNWTNALMWCDRGLNCSPEWESVVRTRRAAILGQMGRFEEAERDLDRSLALERENPGAIDGYSLLAEACRSMQKTDDAWRLLEKWHVIGGKSRNHLYFNKVGNWHYEAGDYAVAASWYRLGVKEKPDDAVLHSNLALALERCRSEGQRLTELTEAAVELRRALELDPQSVEYRERLEQCETEINILQVYGEKAASFEPGITALRVDMADMAELLNEAGDNLSETTRSTVEKYRAQFRERFGVTVPGILFRFLENPEPGAYRITLMEKRSYEGKLDPEDDPLQGIIKRLGPILEAHMGEFLGHEEAMAILKRADTAESKEIQNDSRLLTRFVQLLRDLLARRIPVHSVDTICKELGRTDALDRLTKELGAQE